MDSEKFKGKYVLLESIADLLVGQSKLFVRREVPGKIASDVDILIKQVFEMDPLNAEAQINNLLESHGKLIPSLLKEHIIQKLKSGEYRI